MFLFILILLSTREEKMVTDIVLKRKVPLMVFIKNKALLKQIMKDKLVSDV